MSPLAGYELRGSHDVMFHRVCEHMNRPERPFRGDALDLRPVNRLGIIVATRHGDSNALQLHEEQVSLPWAGGLTGMPADVTIRSRPVWFLCCRCHHLQLIPSRPPTTSLHPSPALAQPLTCDLIGCFAEHPCIGRSRHFGSLPLSRARAEVAAVISYLHQWYGVGF